MFDRCILKKVTDTLDNIKLDVEENSSKTSPSLIIRTHGLQVDESECEFYLRSPGGKEVYLCSVPRFSMSSYGKNKIHVNDYIDAVRNIYYQTFGEAIGFEWENL